MLKERRMNFLCVGFEKAGTTTLDAILRQHSRINLPKIKETQYFYWEKKYKNAQELFWERYYTKKEGICGAVEPEFEYYPREIQSVFGNDVKLIFIMRNPVNRLFSSYRMELRRGTKGFVEQYRQGGTVRLMFEQFVVDRIINNRNGKVDFFVERGKYMKVIRSFLKYFPKENMKFIIFEEFIQNPKFYIDEIQDFLMVPKEELNCHVIENKGNRVSRNYQCACLNSWIVKLNYQLWTNKNIPIILYMKFKLLLDKIMKYTTIETKSKMNVRARKICENFYREDKVKLEEFLEKDLSELWYL